MPYLSRAVLLTFFIFVAGSVTRAQCDEAKTTLQINKCFAKEWKKADAELNSIYQLAEHKLPPDDAGKTEMAWRDYRDGQCAAEGAL